MSATKGFGAANRPDVYTRVTERILADLEAGTRPWMKPWSAANTGGSIIQPLRVTGEPYKGVNVLLLWSEATDKGYTAPTWMTFNQAQELGGHVRKGEHGSLVVYANRIKRTEHDDETGEDIEREIPFMKGYTVFNVEQIDGLPERFSTPAPPPSPAFNRLAHADAFFQNTGARIRHGGGRAFYALDPDYVQMPPFEAFRDAESYAATLAHELTHWTRHPTRLDRDFGRKKWGDEGYAREELVAEIGSAFLCATLRITPEVMPDHAAYLANWQEVLKNDKRFILTAASYAQRAADYLHGLQSTPGPALEQEPAPPAAGVDTPAAPGGFALSPPTPPTEPRRPFNTTRRSASPASPPAAPAAKPGAEAKTGTAPAPGQPRQGELFPRYGHAHPALSV